MADLTKVGNLEKILNGPWVVTENTPMAPETQLYQAIQDAGLKPPDDVVLDGQVHRFSTGEKNDKTGWYVAYSDNVPAGAFGDWKQGINSRWCADVGRELTFNERIAREKHYEAAKKAREAAMAKKHEVVADVVTDIWSTATDASPDHPYLKRKGVQPHGIRVTGDGRLLIPVCSEDGEIRTIQYIDADGKKLFHPGGEAKGNFWMIGEPGKTLYVAEGFATAASIHEATRQAVAVTFSAGNLPYVTGVLRAKYGPTQEVVIVGDNDESGTGQKAAHAAGERYGARVIIPPEIGDANDYAQAGNDLKALLEPETGDWLIPADDFCSQPAPIRWLVKHWLQANAMIMVHGASGGGKTFVVLDWCLRISSGLPDWQGHRVREGKVIYLAGEGHHGLRSRVKGWMIHNGVQHADMWLSRAGCDLNTAEGYQLVVEHVRALRVPPDLIVVDTLHRFLHGDENSAQDAKTMLDACSGLMREFDCSVLLVHHTGVSAEAQHRARGSSAWKGALENEISVTMQKDKAIQLVQKKAKDSKEAEDVWLSLEAVPIPGWLDEDGEQVTTAVIEAGEEPEQKKKDSKLNQYIKLLDRAWFATGAQIDIESNPYIRRSDLIEFLVGEGMTEGTAKNMTKPSCSGKLIGYLMNAEIIQNSENGWAVIDNSLASSMLTRRNQKL